MAREVTFSCPLRTGLHARPAAVLSAAARPFTSDITLINCRTGTAVNAKSALSVLTADVHGSDACVLKISGSDEETASKVLRALIEETLPHCDDDLLAAEAGGTTRIPRTLVEQGIACWTGTPASGGVGRGRVVRVQVTGVAASVTERPVGSPADEMTRIERALVVVGRTLRPEEFARLDAAARAIQQAHAEILADPAIREMMLHTVAAGQSAAQAIASAVAYYRERLERSESAVVRERAIDVEDIGVQLLDAAYGHAPESRTLTLTEPTILVAERLAPRQLIACDRRLLQGLVLRGEGTTSHAVILARSFGVPTVVGVHDALSVLADGADVIVDGRCGLVVPATSDVAVRYFESQRDVLARRAARRASATHGPARTRDGRRLDVAANVSTADEVAPAIEAGAAGIGLFRTEMLFLDRAEPPSEEEQFEHYAAAVRAAASRPVTIRTLDIGGDKPAPYVRQLDEANPFLGYRGIRIYADHESLFMAQLRAILRASALGPVRLLLPMVATVEEVRWVRGRVAAATAELSASGARFDARMPIGVMIEVPSALFMLESLCREIDFVSIGTNDLTQYLLAAERGHEAVRDLCNVRQPALFRALRMIADSVRRAGRKVCMCGEMARDLASLPVLVGLGLDEVSVAGPDVPAVRGRLADLSGAMCDEAARAALACETLSEVEAVIAELGARTAPRPLIEADLVLLDDASTSKAEAIRAMVDALHVVDRTSAPQQVEDAVWARESVESTAIGFGFATPHCKSDALAANSVVVMRLANDVDWGAEDGTPVRVAVMLALRASEDARLHMRLLAQLARRLMHEEFRTALLTACDSRAVLHCLRTELGLEAESAMAGSEA